MSWIKRIRGVFGRERLDAELGEEMRAHLEMRAANEVRNGMSAEEARYDARRRFGNVTLQHERAREMDLLRWLETLAQDVRFGLRMLRKSPGFTAVAVLTLALGIGANTAIFSLLNTVMLRVLPVQKPEELVQIALLTKNFGGRVRTSYTNPLWEAVRDRQNVFAGTFAWGTSEFNLSTGGEAQDVKGLYASGDYFDVLGVRAASGRLISRTDDQHGCPGVAVLSYGFWNERYGREPVVGKTISLDGHAFPIIGVSAPGFFGTNVGSTFDVAVPICAEAVITGIKSSLDVRSSWWFRVMGRLKPGERAETASAGMDVLAPQIFAATVPLNWKPDDQKNFLQWKFTALPGGTGVSGLRGQYTQPLQFLMAAALLVLLIACANIASLMLARAAARRHEVGVRLAVGASRGRLVRQLLTECLLLSAVGAAVGVMFARWGSELLVRFISTQQNKVFLDITLDARVLGFTAGAAILTALLFGVLPALRSTRVPVAGAIRGEAGALAGRDTRFRAGKWTVAAQVAISVVLVTTAALFVRSFEKLVNLDIGFDRNGVLMSEVFFRSGSGALPENVNRNDEILARVRAVPGVRTSSESVVTPISHRTWDDEIVVDRPNAPKGLDSDVDMNYVTPGYFATLRSNLLEGRDFSEHDAANAPKVAIVNQALTRKFFGNEDPIGKTFRRYASSSTELGEPFEIVGLVQDAKYDTLREDFPPTAFFPLEQIPAGLDRVYVESRTAVEPQALAAAIVHAIESVDRSASVVTETLGQQVDDSLAQERLLATLSGFFGALALLLALIGLYGVLAYLVLQRRQEIGIRMALGARGGAILRLVMRDVALLLGAGLLVGISVTWAATRYAQSLLYDLRANDPASLALGACALAIVALVAAYLPARRAMRVDPMVALRHE
jgi:putative ABC transport system permease protein